MKDILGWETPDLIVLNGDLITGDDTMLANATAYVDAVVAPLVAKQLPWASSYGNHDRDFNLSASALYAREKAHGFSLTESMVPGDEDAVGVTNYFLPVFPSVVPDEAKDGDVAPALMLYFLDSRGGHAFQRRHANGKRIGIPSVVSDEAIAWLRTTVADITRQYKRVIPSVLFTHIPPSAMLAYQSTPSTSGGGPHPHRQPGLNDDTPLAAQEADGNLLAALAELADTGGLRATFSGHDHGDDWCFRWTSRFSSAPVAGTGSFHCFGRRSGYGGYGRWTRGSRQILFAEDALAEEISTWVRLEDESVSGRVSLNRTYGDDEYPAVDY